MDADEDRSVEVEIKLDGDSAELQKAFASPAARPGRAVKLISHYYDTPRGDLAGRMLSLRVRKTGRKHELTLKSKGSSSLERGEWTVALTRPEPDTALLPDAALGLLEGVSAKDLERQHGTEVMRRTRIVERNGARIECALDIGRIVADGRDVPLAEIEYELKSGGVDELLLEVEEVLGRHPLGFLALSKAERGVTLATGARPAPVKSSPAAFDAGDRLGEALAAFVGSAAEHAIGNIEPVKDGTDPEGVHQMRVALRRLRSAFGLFKDRLSPAALEADALARDVLKTLGRIRDLDVFLGETLPPVMASAPEGLKAGMGALERKAMAERREAQAAARQLAAGPLMARLVVRLVRLSHSPQLLVRESESPISEIAPELMSKRHSRVLKKGRGYAKLPWESRHEVRIIVKKLRYALDFLSPVFSERQSKRFARTLSRLQDDMGLANDAHVAQDLALALAGEDADAKAGAAFVCGWQQRALAEGEQELVDAWRDFRKQKPFWKA